MQAAQSISPVQDVVSQACLTAWLTAFPTSGLEADLCTLNNVDCQG